MKKLALVTALALVGVGGFGCNNNRVDEPLADAQPQISLMASNKDIVAGEVSTFTVNSRNTLGRDAQVDWSSTGGDLKTAENDRIARVTFDEAGVFTVTATLIVDGREVDREMVNINVRPLK